MADYAHMNLRDREQLQQDLEQQYDQFKKQHFALNMARGKPSKSQLDLSMDMLGILGSCESCISVDNTDCRNYGVTCGLPEAKDLMAYMLDDKPENVIVFGNASLNIMYDTMAGCWMFGTLGETPWCRLEEVKWLCPSPGYDRHFAVTETFGIQMIPVSMTDEGPCMDEVESLVAADSSIKGIWCVPKYSNPTGITYSDDVVRRLANMKCAANDFRIFWDNAYSVHHLYTDALSQDCVLDIAGACNEAGNPNRYYKFTSTSKVTFPGSGIAALAASPANITEIKNRMSVQTIGHDKLNQLRHVRFLRDSRGIAAHMEKHAALLRPKFDLVQQKLEAGLTEVGNCLWNSPRGGYFVSLDAPEGTATRAVELAKQAGVTLTDAGATYPYGKDPRDSNIRIAPSLPPVEELDAAMDVLICCIKLAYLEKLRG